MNRFKIFIVILILFSISPLAKRGLVVAGYPYPAILLVQGEDTLNQQVGSPKGKHSYLHFCILTKSEGEVYLELGKFILS